MAIKIYSGKYLEDHTYEDLMKLKRKQLMELFCLLDAPSMSEMHGEYRAFLLDSGYIINNCLSRMYLHFTWGNWQRKGFEPLGKLEGHGNNTFITTQSRLYENYFLWQAS